jgi:D-beta-D-heptose 7-phosphate kinase/D-beta-D-heptose 1-phosphate adenosyltransferase
LIKANWAEATEAASCEHPRPLALARKLSDAHGFDVVITLGRYGMVCAELSGATWYLSATPTEVRDVCGAGDTVFAVLGVAQAQGHGLSHACQIANAAASQQVATVGIALPQSDLTLLFPAAAVIPPAQPPVIVGTCRKW